MRLATFGCTTLLLLSGVVAGAIRWLWRDYLDWCRRNGGAKD